MKCPCAPRSASRNCPPKSCRLHQAVVSHKRGVVMNMNRNILLTLLLLLAGSIASFAQTEQTEKLKPTRPAPPVTISITAEGVRFVAPGGFGQMRLEVFDASGQPLYDSGFQPGTVRDWAVQDKQGQTLA